jgi:excisionase family DNA binding protein
MPTETHRLLSGETLEYERPTGLLATFLQRVRDAVHDPRVTEAELSALLYGPENPLLDQTAIPGRGVVTRAVFADPRYHLMLDLLAQKRVQEGTLDVDKAAARYTLTVAEAAERAGVHESAIRQAIAAHRLPSWKRGTRHYLSPEDVDAYKPARHGPAPPLEVRFGSKEGARLSIKHDGGELVVDSKEGNIQNGHLERWRRVGVLAGSSERARFWLVEPGDELEEIGHAGFFVRGRMRVVSKENNALRARAAFKNFVGLQRYYLHGDRNEKDPTRFYCRRCDLFEEPAHFELVDHRRHWSSDYARSAEVLRGYESQPTPRFYRPVDAKNLLAADIAADARATPPPAPEGPFWRWLKSQADRQDPVGDFARDAVLDESFPRDATVQKVRAYMVPFGDARDAVKEALREFAARRR